MHSLDGYGIRTVQDIVVKEALKVGFNEKYADLISRVKIRLDNVGVTYYVSYFESPRSNVEDVITDTLVAKESDILNTLDLCKPIYKDNDFFRMGLCVIVLDVNMNNWPMLYLEYELTAKEKEDQ